VAGCVVEYEKALSPAFCEAFENVDGLIDLLEKIVRVEEPIAIFARLEDDPGFPDRCEMCEINV
jgi:hypothetical protein